MQKKSIIGEQAYVLTYFANNASSQKLPVLRKKLICSESLTFFCNPATISDHYEKTMETAFSYSIKAQHHILPGFRKHRPSTAACCFETR